MAKDNHIHFVFYDFWTTINFIGRIFISKMEFQILISYYNNKVGINIKSIIQSKDVSVRKLWDNLIKSKLCSYKNITNKLNIEIIDKTFLNILYKTLLFFYNNKKKHPSLAKLLYELSFK